jgi:hypothetical protein
MVEWLPSIYICIRPWVQFLALKKKSCYSCYERFSSKFQVSLWRNLKTLYLTHLIEAILSVAYLLPLKISQSFQVNTGTFLSTLRKTANILGGKGDVKNWLTSPFIMQLLWSFADEMLIGNSLINLLVTNAQSRPNLWRFHWVSSKIHLWIRYRTFKTK